MKLELFLLLLLFLALGVTGTCARAYDTQNHQRDQTPNPERFINADDKSGHIDIDGDDDDNDVVPIYGDEYGDDDGSDFGGFNAEDARGNSLDGLIEEATQQAQSLESSHTPDQTNTIIVDGDMEFTREELEAFNRTVSSKDKRSAAMTSKTRLWDKNHVPYQMEPQAFSTQEIHQIKQGMDIWSAYTCLTFAPATQGDRIYFKNGDGCTSHVGKTGGAHHINLAPHCRTTPTVVHELGHAIGLYHEQHRPDRDSYITVHKENMKDKYRFTLRKFTWEKVKNLGIFYDYLSIMHYGQRAFSKDGQLTISTKNPAYQDVIGQRKRVSFRDIKTVNLMYNCRKVKSCKLIDSQCPGEGFVGTDCKCWCPGDPYVLCDMDKTTDDTCQDYNLNCVSWSRKNYCTNQTFQKYMSKKCRFSCGLCSVESCKDDHKHCQAWTKRGECQDSPLYMLKNCRKSCGQCGDKTCPDEHQHCLSWAQAGECDKNPAFMLTKCKKSCNVKNC